MVQEWGDREVYKDTHFHPVEQASAIKTPT